MVQLLVCDDSADVRASLRALLGELEDVEIVGEAADGEEAVRLALELRPDVAAGPASPAAAELADEAARAVAVVRADDAVALPLVHDADVLGALVVVESRADEQLLAAVAELVAATLTSERRAAASFAEARRDALTGLGNKRAFDEHLETMLQTAALVG